MNIEKEIQKPLLSKQLHFKSFLICREWQQYNEIWNQITKIYKKFDKTFYVSFNLSQIQYTMFFQFRFDLEFYWSNLSFWWSVKQNKINTRWQGTRIKTTNIGDTVVTLGDVKVVQTVTYQNISIFEPEFS